MNKTAGTKTSPGHRRSNLKEGAPSSSSRGQNDDQSYSSCMQPGGYPSNCGAGVQSSPTSPPVQVVENASSSALHASSSAISPSTSSSPTPSKIPVEGTEMALIPGEVVTQKHLNEISKAYRGRNCIGINEYKRDPKNQDVLIGRLVRVGEKTDNQPEYDKYRPEFLDSAPIPSNEQEKILRAISEKNQDRINKFLRIAAHNGDAQIVWLLLENGAQVNQADSDGITALMIAAKRGHAFVVGLLLEKGAQVNQADSDGITALMIAEQNGHMGVVELLLEAEADAITRLNEGASSSSSRGQGDDQPYQSRMQPGDYASNCGAGVQTSASSSSASSSALRAPSSASIIQNSAGKKTPNQSERYEHILEFLDIDQVEAILWAIDKKDHYHINVFIMRAAHNGYTEIARLLLGAGGKVSLFNSDGITALMIAAKRGHTGVVELLLEAGADVNQAGSDGRTALMFAAYNGHTDVVKLLLKAKADVKQANSDGQTALMFAEQKGHTEIKNLLEFAERNHDLINLYLRTAAHDGYRDVVKLWLEDGADVNQADSDGRTALMFAEQKEHTEIKNLLLEAGADDSAPNPSELEKILGAIHEKNRALMNLYLRTAAKRGHTGVVELLLKNGAQVNQADSNGITALMIAAKHGNKKIVELLLKNGAQVNQADNHRWTALMFAAEDGNTDVVELLLGASADAIRLNGRPRHDVVELLLGASADVNLVNYYKITALMIAAKQGHAKIVSLLLEKNATVNLTDYWGFTALHLAAKEGHAEIVELLLKEKAQVDLPNTDGITALHLAQLQGHNEIINLLQRQPVGHDQ